MRVLLVDAAEQMRHAIARRMRQAEIEPVGVASGAEALTLVGERLGLPLTLLKFVGRNDDSIMDYAASLFDSTVGSGSGCKAATSLGMSA
jgi:DNA-binding response OmpR family regulator